MRIKNSHLTFPRGKIDNSDVNVIKLFFPGNLDFAKLKKVWSEQRCENDALECKLSITFQMVCSCCFNSGKNLDFLPKRFYNIYCSNRYESFSAFLHSPKSRQSSKSVDHLGPLKRTLRPKRPKLKGQIWPFY